MLVIQNYLLKKDITIEEINKEKSEHKQIITLNFLKSTKKWTNAQYSFKSLFQIVPEEFNIDYENSTLGKIKNENEVLLINDKVRNMYNVYTINEYENVLKNLKEKILEKSMCVLENIQVYEKQVRLSKVMNIMTSYLNNDFLLIDNKLKSNIMRFKRNNNIPFEYYFDFFNRHRYNKQVEPSSDENYKIIITYNIDTLNDKNSKEFLMTSFLEKNSNMEYYQHDPLSRYYHKNNVKNYQDTFYIGSSDEILKKFILFFGSITSVDYKIHRPVM